MATRRTYMQSSCANRVVTAFGRFQFSGSAGIAGFTGSGIDNVVLSGSTYTVTFSNAWPQVMDIGAQLALNTSYLNTASGSVDVVFNGAQLAQLTTFNTGSAIQATGSGQAQTVDFNVTLGNGNAVVLPYQSGSNWCLLRATFVNMLR